MEGYCSEDCERSQDPEAGTALRICQQCKLKQWKNSHQVKLGLLEVTVRKLGGSGKPRSVARLEDILVTETEAQ